MQNVHMRGIVMFNTIVNTILWIIVIFLISFDIVFLVQFLRIRPRTTKRLVGLLSICLVTLAALAGLVYIQIYNIDSIKSHSYYLFLSTLFIEQVIIQWTLNDQALASSSHSRLVRRIRAIMTGFVIVYVLIVLVVLIFRL